jgi:hypothetical protein|tara:strand:- start:353 stop:541 length:189 start_codon:yes stop_codon:yes gene_type:complete
MIFQTPREYEAMLQVKRSVEYTLNQLRTSQILDRNAWILSLETIKQQIEIWETGGEDVRKFN